jgi:DNA/RNA endonuclease YhcR with UshA esterase domain
MIKSSRKHLKYILPVLILVMIIGLIFSRVYQPDSSIPEPEVNINASDAANYIGYPAKVCGDVVSVRYIPSIGGRPTFLNFGQPDPNQYFTAVIWGENREKWAQAPEQQYQQQTVCVTGRIESHEGTPQIIVKVPNQIQVQR